MRHVIPTILLALVTWARAEGRDANQAHFMDKIVDKLVDKLIGTLLDLALTATSSYHADLFNNTLGRPTQLAPFPSPGQYRTVAGGLPHKLSEQTAAAQFAKAAAPRYRRDHSTDQAIKAQFSSSLVEPGLANVPANASNSKPGVGAVKHIVAVASCKGGVGKSTTAVNLAYALSSIGNRVGIVDLDIYGSSLPTMVRTEGKLEFAGQSMLPLEANGVKLMSSGFINSGAVTLRGTMVTSIVQDLVGRTFWGELDYLIVDMPPGTGDVQLTLSQEFRVSAAVLVTTPQVLAFVDVVRGVDMFEKVGIPTIAIVENMDGLRDPQLAIEAEQLIARHSLSQAAASDFRDLLDTPQPVFGESHLHELKEMWGINASFSLPLLPDVAASADNGVPIFLSAPHSEAAAVYKSLAKAVDADISKLATEALPLVVFSAEENLIRVLLTDGTEQDISPIELRKLCRSPTNTLENLPADLRPLEIVPMGRYAVLVNWSDGHGSVMPYKSFVRGYLG